MKTNLQKEFNQNWVKTPFKPDTDVSFAESLLVDYNGFHLISLFWIYRLRIGLIIRGLEWISSSL